MFGSPLRHVGETGSTNDDAAQWARAGASHGSVVRADAQTQGRGRLGRNWSSPPGLGLYFSIILRPEMEMTRVHHLTMLAALASARAVEEATAWRANVKWPNDIVLHGRKIGGVLSEAQADEMGE
jgi:BirA family biotin operon repressor/biotin-[acetyl-CoA-carboxylase] ligase